MINYLNNINNRGEQFNTFINDLDININDTFRTKLNTVI